MSAILKFLKFGLVKGGKVAASATGSWVFGEVASCLGGLLGYQSQNDQDKEKLKNWMGSVSSQLNILDAKIDSLSTAVDKGFGDVKRDHIFQDYQSQYNATEKDRTIIGDAYDRLVGIMNKNYKDAEEAKAAIGKLQDYLIRNSFLTATHYVASVWGSNPSTANTVRNILENYTDVCILSIDDDISKLKHLYDNLEYNFELGLYSLYKAYVVMVAVRNYETGGDPNDPDYDTSKWLENEVNTIFKAIGDNFASCVERLLLSTYRPDLGGVDPVFGDSVTLFNIGVRSQLHFFQLTDLNIDVSNPGNPGLIIKEYLRPSMPASGEPKISVNIDGKLQEIKGKKWLAPIKYRNGDFMTYWYKVVDKDKNGNLVAFEDSDITVMNYQLPYKGTDLNDAVAYTSDYKTNNYDAKGTTQYFHYDPDTFERLIEKADDTLCLAYAVVADHLAYYYKEAWPISYPDMIKGQFVFENQPQINALNEHAIKESTHVKGPGGQHFPQLVFVDCSFGPTIFAKDHEIGFKAKYPVTYAKQSFDGVTAIKSRSGQNGQVGLLLINETKVDIAVGDYKNGGWAMRACDIGVDIYAVVNNTKTPFFRHKYGSNTNTYHVIDLTGPDENSYNPKERPNTDKKSFGIPVIPGAKTEITFEVIVYIQKYDGSLYSPNSYDNYVRGAIYMQGRFAWPRPKPI